MDGALCHKCYYSDDEDDATVRKDLIGFSNLTVRVPPVVLVRNRRRRRTRSSPR